MIPRFRIFDSSSSSSSSSQKEKRPSPFALTQKVEEDRAEYNPLSTTTTKEDACL